MRSFVFGLLLVSCASQPPPAEPTPPQTADCVAECEKKHQMRAVAQEQITADCEAECPSKPE